jgi:iron-sulfur cluster assembly protein
VERIKQLVEADAEENKSLRIEVKMGGCAGIAYNFSLVSKPEEGDAQVECEEGIFVYIAKKAVFFILNSELDYVDLGNFSKKFIFRNPNAKGGCGCGESFAV